MKAEGGKEEKNARDGIQANARSLGYQAGMGSKARIESFSFLKVVTSLR